MRWLGAALLLCGCSGASGDPGLRAWLRVPNAQFVEGPMPAPGAGAAIVAASLSRQQVPREDSELQLTGSLALSSIAIAAGLEGDVGFWVIQAGLPDPTVPGFLTFARSVGIAANAPLGPATLHLQPYSEGAVAGPRTDLSLEIIDPSQPSGELVISLTWDTPTDLDLHVVDSAGVEIWARNPNSWSPVPGQPSDPGAWKSGGLLDVDSNEACRIDGRDAEHVVWTQPPPSGHYLVRVDTFSLCGVPSARWRVSAVLRGVEVGSASGVSTADSTRGAHDLGAGLTALEFDVP